jgi:hypothetical protein
MSTNTKTPETVVNCIAEMAHEVNRVYCKAHGDMTARRWDKAPEWQKNSAVAGVMAILRDPKLTPEESHQNWVAYKALDGWVYGETKDELAKTHPCMVDYTALPEYQRRKDNLFGIITRLGIALFFEEVPEEQQPSMPDEPAPTENI